LPELISVDSSKNNQRICSEQADACPSGRSESIKRIQWMKEPNRSDYGVAPFGISFFAVVGLCIWLVFIIASCAPKPRMLLQDQTPENVWRCARENQVEFTSLAGLMDLQLKGKEAKYSGTVEIYYQAPDTFAFYPRSFFGMNIFQALGQDDSLTVYFPREKQYFAGKYSDLENTRLWSWQIPFRLFFELILLKEGLTDSNAVFLRNAGDLWIYSSEDNGWMKEYHVDAQKCRLVKSRYTNTNAGESYLIEYKSYKRYGKREYPTGMKIISSQRDMASVRFHELKFDFDIPEQKLQLKMPPESKKVELLHVKPKE
jgi:hypothetical protein